MPNVIFLDTVKEYDSATSFGKNPTDDQDSSSDEMISSDATNSCVENSDNDEEETSKPSPLIPNRFASASALASSSKDLIDESQASSSKNLVDESQIIQTLEYLDTKAVSFWLIF